MIGAPHNLAAIRFGEYVGVCRITECLDVQRFLRAGKTVSGKWLVKWWEQELRSGEIKVIRQQVFATEADAKCLFREWKKEFQAPHIQFRKAMAESDPKRLLGQDAPEGCMELAAVDLEDADRAARDELRRLYPQCVALFDQLKHAPEINRNGLRRRLERAYVLDVAALAGRVIDPAVPGQGHEDFIMELSRALKNGQAPRNARDTRDAAINADLRLNWIRLRYCFMPSEKLAATISVRHKLKGQSRLTPAAIKMRLRRLSLQTKRNPGPSPRPGNW